MEQTDLSTATRSRMAENLRWRSLWRGKNVPHDAAEFAKRTAEIREDEEILKQLGEFDA